MKTLSWTGIILWALVLTVGGWLSSMWFNRPFDLWNTAGIALLFVWGANTLQKLAEMVDKLTDRVSALERELALHDNAIRAIPRPDPFPDFPSNRT